MLKPSVSKDKVYTLANGLRSWVEYTSLNDPGPRVIHKTEDPSIFLEGYPGLGRENLGCDLLHFKGDRVGVSTHAIRNNAYDLPDKSAGKFIASDGKENVIYEILHVGCPVFDFSRIYFLDEQGKLPSWRHRERNFRFNKLEGFVTPLTWEAYNAGKRDTFSSRENLEEAILILPQLLIGRHQGMIGPRPNHPKYTEECEKDALRKFPLSSGVIEEIQAGRLCK